MAHSQIVCAYKCSAVGNVSASNLATRMAAVPLDLSLPKLVGLIPSADATATVGNVVTRTITLKMGSLYTSFAGFTVNVGSPASAILGYTLPGSGLHLDYPAPPVVSVLDSAAGGHGAGAIIGLSMGIGAANVIAGGSGYTGATTMTVPAPIGSGVAAVLTPTIALGAITGFTIVMRGSGYGNFEQVTITDSGGGTGAVVYASLTPVKASLFLPGSSYTTPQMNMVTRFQNSFPDSSSAVQASAVRSWMTLALSQALSSPIVEVAPVVS